MFVRFPFSLLNLWLLLGLAVIPTALLAEEQIDYLRDVKPLLVEKCYSCHGVLKQESDLRLDTRGLMLEGGVIEPGDAKSSLILERIAASGDERMPPLNEGAPLREQDQELIRKWILQGASAPDEPIPLGPEDHWAFTRIGGHDHKQSGLAHGELDALISAKHKHYQLKPQQAAPRTIQLRRLYLDLIGLPPTQSQLDDPRPWNEIVDELLESPQHGERWARHWMDIWRYADGYGLGAQLRYSQKHLWHWRDWIIESLNEDIGYDQMILQMLAGDELAPEDPEVVRATGFLARNYYLFNRTTWLDHTIEHTGKAFLGLTLNCAKCHDHKYDPITHEDYYSFRAIFEPHQVRLDPVPGEGDFEKGGLPRVFDDHLEKPTYLHLRGDPKNPDQSTDIRPRVPELFVDFQPPIHAIQLPRSAYDPGSRSYVGETRLAAADQAIEKAQSALKTAREQLSKAATDEESSPAEDLEFLVEESFDQVNSKRWEIVGKEWQYIDGRLHQTQSTRDASYVRLKQKLPQDFELVCRYETTGGSTYKSVTFRFDESDDKKYANYVYTSAHAPGPKVQVAYSRNGNSAYPAQGRKAHKVQVGKSYTLRFAVRDTLVNVWLDDQFMVAYRYPNRSSDGHLSLSGFDATVAFDSLTIRGLPESVQLTESANTPPMTTSEAEQAVAVAQATLELKQAARQTVLAENELNELRRTGQDTIVALREAARHQLEEKLASARLSLLSNASDPKLVKTANKQIEDLEKTLQRDRLEDEFTPFRGAKKALESPAHKETDYPPVYPQTSSGRRLALAKWLIAPENPLTARVAVNHIWMRHFGEPLVESVFDFGLRARRPIQVDVLDYLAVELIESGWSFRHVHRLIVNSEAYRRSSSNGGADEATLRFDPDNLYLWRMNSRRMEAQVVRDSLLHLANQLDTTVGGPSIDVGSDSRRRSLYFKHSRDDQDQFLTMFDDADLLQCYRRSESIVPQQALALSNSKLTFELAAEIARTMESAEESEAQFVNKCFVRLLARQSSLEEQEACLEFLQRSRDLLSEQDPDMDGSSRQRRAHSRLVHTLLNHNDFISVR